MRRVGIFGWGVVAPRCRDIDAFERNLASAESWLSPFNGFGPDNFLVGSYEEEEFYQDLLQVTGGETNEELARMMIRASSDLKASLRILNCFGAKGGGISLPRPGR